MTKHRPREKLVRTLNAAAKDCGLSEVPVTSKKAKVLTLIAAIRATSGPLVAKTAADTACASIMSQPQGEASCSKLCQRIAQSV